MGYRRFILFRIVDELESEFSSVLKHFREHVQIDYIAHSLLQFNRVAEFRIALPYALNELGILVDHKIVAGVEDNLLFFGVLYRDHRNIRDRIALRRSAHSNRSSFFRLFRWLEEAHDNEGKEEGYEEIQDLIVFHGGLFADYRIFSSS